MNQQMLSGLARALNQNSNNQFIPNLSQNDLNSMNQSGLPAPAMPFTSTPSPMYSALNKTQIDPSLLQWGSKFVAPQQQSNSQITPMQQIPYQVNQAPTPQIPMINPWTQGLQNLKSYLGSSSNQSNPYNSSYNNADPLSYQNYQTGQGLFDSGNGY